LNVEQYWAELSQHQNELQLKHEQLVLQEHD